MIYKFLAKFSKINDLNFVYFIILLFPVALILGPLIAEIFLILIIILTFIIHDFKKNFKDIIKKSLFIKLIFLFSIYVFFLSLFYYENLDILKTGLFYFRYLLFSLAIFYLLLKKPDVLKYFFVFYLILMSIILADSLIQYIYGKNIIGYPKYASRLVSFFENEGILGSFIVRFYSLVAIFYFLSKFKFNKIFLSIFCFLIFILIIFTLERSALILFLISNFLILFSISKNRSNFLKNFIIILMVVTLSFSIFSTKNSFFFERYYVQTKNEVLKFFDETIDYKRKNILIVSYYMGSENILFGQGPKSFRYKCQELDYQVKGTREFDLKKRLDLNCITHPHNYLFQLYAETGFIGLIFYLLFIFFLLRIIFFHSNKNLNLIYLKLASISLLINIFPIIGNGNFFNNFLNMIFYYNLGFFLYFYKIASQNV